MAVCQKATTSLAATSVRSSWLSPTDASFLRTESTVVVFHQCCVKEQSLFIFSFLCSKLGMIVSMLQFGRESTVFRMIEGVHIALYFFL